MVAVPPDCASADADGVSPDWAPANWAPSDWAPSDWAPAGSSLPVCESAGPLPVAPPLDPVLAVSVAVADSGAVVEGAEADSDGVDAAGVDAAGVDEGLDDGVGVASAEFARVSRVTAVVDAPTGARTALMSVGEDDANVRDTADEGAAGGVSAATMVCCNVCQLCNEPGRMSRPSSVNDPGFSRPPD